MSDEFPEDLGYGDLFNGTLIAGRDSKGGRLFRVKELSNRRIENMIKTIMGWRDLSCLSFDYLLLDNSNRRYRCEIVSSEKQRLVCRALEPTRKNSLGYQVIQDAEIRHIPEYDVGDEVVVVPSKHEWKDKSEQPFLLFYDPLFEHYNERMIGRVYVNQDILVKDLVGRRILARVNKKSQVNGELRVNSEFLEEAS